MQRRFQVLIAAAGLGLISWYGLATLSGGNDSVVAIAKASASTADLPDTPEEWHGRIDYPMLDRQLTELTARPEMTGLAVAVVERGRLSFVGTYGITDRANSAPVTPDTVFRWASVSKTVAGTMAATLAAESKIDLERPVSYWRTSLRLPGGAESQITLSQLLAQRTGLTKNAYDEKLEAGESPVLIRGQLVDAPLQCQPGTCHTYQNVAFDTASEAIEKATGRKYADLVSERFFLPLGMTSATFGMAGLTQAKNWARPHRGSQLWPIKENFWRVPAAAGIQSNIVDFARWMQAAMGRRPDVLPDSVLRLAQMPRVGTARLYGGELKQAISGAHYGLGWRSFEYDGLRLVGHSGAVDGFRTTLIFDPKTQVGVVAMWNGVWGKPFRIPFSVMDSYYKRDGSRWLDLDDAPRSAENGIIEGG